MTHWSLGPGKVLTLERPRVIAILNITPDSFYDGGSLLSVDAALAAADRAIVEGADMLDIGGESTRPGSGAVEPADQVHRVIPVITAVRRRHAIPISIDTTRAEVARAALDAGADAVNDTSAGTDDPGMLPLVAQRARGVILMHRLRRPADDSYSDRYREDPRYDDVVVEVKRHLAGRAEAAIAAGVAKESIVVDPGLGFGKTVEQNLELIRRTPELADLGYPVLSALSRKSFVGRASGLVQSAPAERLAGTLALSVAHYTRGARLFRVHDVAPHVQALGATHAALPL